MSANSAIQIQKLDGLILTAPHARSVIEGDKTLVIDSKKLDFAEQFLLISNDDALGTVTLGKPKEIDLKTFKKLRDKHRITDEEREARWPDRQKLFAHAVKIVEKFSEPQKVQRPRRCPPGFKWDPERGECVAKKPTGLPPATYKVKPEEADKLPFQVGVTEEAALKFEAGDAENLRLRPSDLGEPSFCKNCRFFREEDGFCIFLDQIVPPESICDGINLDIDRLDFKPYIEQLGKLDLRAFTEGMKVIQPFQHRVLGALRTTENDVRFIIEDGIGHRFSIGLPFSLEHWIREHGWSPEDFLDIQNKASDQIDESAEEQAESTDPGEGEVKKFVRLIKSEDSKEQRTAFGIVLEPETVDGQGDIYSAEVIEEAAHRFMENYQKMGEMHRRLRKDVKVLESFIAPCDMEIQGHKIKKGTWLMKVRILANDLWKRVKNGQLAGFSIGGLAVSEPTSASTAA